ncbi:sensor histidine kinase [Paenibacillus sp. 598K]|uniref:sensor histidine kinase n=1 Tax=Paenibacillus sp. 598K TaxID=1117987 RepID=UPI000FFEE4CD|nr:histidine kinase [Paenibacillus sp. 598K]
MFALAYLLRRFTRPIQTLGKAARQIEAGNLTVRSSIRGEDEVGSLGRSFDHMLDRIEQMMQEFRTEQELKRRAEIAMLQAQLHPHFLFNVLSSIRMRLLLQKDEDNAKLLATLAALLRSSFSRQGEFVTLSQELESARQYIELMRFAMRHPTTYEIDVEPELLDATVPRLILQPIIENAYKHGFARKGGSVVIQIGRSDNKLILTIKNNGARLSSETIAELERRLAYEPHEYDTAVNPGAAERGIGLYNVSTRLKLIYGDDFQMLIQSNEPEWTSITLVLPMHPVAEGGTSHV